MEGSRPRRASAQAAQRRLDEQDVIVIGSSEGESSGDDDSAEADGDEGEPNAQGDGEEAGAAGATLSAYEVQRLENIARNDAVLRSLGLVADPAAAPSATSATTPKQPRPPKRAVGSGSSDGGSGGQRPSRQQPSRSARQRDEGEGSGCSASTGAHERREPPPKRSRPPAEQAPGAPARADAREAAPPEASLPEFSAEDVDAYFAIMSQHGGPMAGGGIDATALRRTIRELQQEGGFPPDEIEHMVDVFDQGGKGALSIDDVRGAPTTLGPIAWALAHGPSPRP